MPTESFIVPGIIRSSVEPKAQMANQIHDAHFLHVGRVHARRGCQPRSLPHTPVNARLSTVDTDLFEAIQADRDGWKAEVFQRYREAVTRLVRYQLRGSAEDVDDIVVDVFVRFIERPAHVRQAENLRAYLLSIARNAVREEIRRRVRHRRLLALTDAPEGDLLSTDDPVARAALLELGAILGRLGERDRRAYVLRAVVGLEVDAVARHLGLSRSTARRRITAASTFVRKSAARNALLSTYL